MTTAQPGLRLAVDRDVHFICALIETTMRGYIEESLGSFDEQQVREHTQHSVDQGLYRMIEFDGRGIGALAVKREPDHMQLEQMFIAPSHQNRGLGTQLVQALVQEALQASLPVRLRVLSSNPARACSQ